MTAICKMLVIILIYTITTITIHYLLADVWQFSTSTTWYHHEPAQVVWCYTVKVILIIWFSFLPILVAYGFKVVIPFEDSFHVMLRWTLSIVEAYPMCHTSWQIVQELLLILAVYSDQMSRILSAVQSCRLKGFANIKKSITVIVPLNKIISTA